LYSVSVRIFSCRWNFHCLPEVKMKFESNCNNIIDEQNNVKLSIEISVFVC